MIGNAIAASANKEVRVSVLGHIQRGGSPTPFDRILATRFGVAAVDLIAQGGFGQMVCLRSSRIEAVDIAQAIGSLKTVDPNGQMVRPPGPSVFPSGTAVLRRSLEMKAGSELRENLTP